MRKQRPGEGHWPQATDLASDGATMGIPPNPRPKPDSRSCALATIPAHSPPTRETPPILRGSTSGCGERPSPLHHVSQRGWGGAEVAHFQRVPGAATAGLGTTPRVARV